MRTSFLLAASIASIFTLASIDRSAVAQMMPDPMASTAKPKAAKASPRRAAAAPRRKTTARGYLPGAGKKGPGRCGPFMYWKAGRCVDARTSKK
jgi:hypothetical protein